MISICPQRLGGVGEFSSSPFLDLVSKLLDGTPKFDRENCGTVVLVVVVS
jgi:hypothetical protein